MKVRVRLFGTLGNAFSDHDPIDGFEVDLPSGSQVADLLRRLGIAEEKVGIVSVDGQLVKPHEALKAGNLVRVFRPIFGG